MTTPVDIDKLKELCDRVSAEPLSAGYPQHMHSTWLIDMNRARWELAQQFPAILAALIAKAERVADAEELLRQAMNVLGTVDANYALDPIADDGTTVWNGMQAESKRLWKLYREHLAARNALSPKESE